MADWCDINNPFLLKPPKKSRTRFGVLANNGYWCRYSLIGSVTIDYAGVSHESGSGAGTVTGSNGVFTFTPPLGLTSIDVISYGGGGGAGGASSGTEGCVGGCGYNGLPGNPGFAGQKVALTITPLSSHSITIGLGGAGGPGAEKSGDTDNPNGGTNGLVGIQTTFFGLGNAAGGAFGYASDDHCGNSSGCDDGLPGQDSEIGIGGTGGTSQGDGTAGGGGRNGGLSAGGGAGGGGGGGDSPGDDGEGGGDGGSGGNGRVTISWDITHIPAILATWC